MPKINQIEYEILKSLDDKWKWIARDEKLLTPDSSLLNTFETEPDKRATYWVGSFNIKQVDEDLFQFVQWTDEEPYSIAELIEEYEHSTQWWERFAVGDLESEEKEVKKDIEWLKEEIGTEMIRLEPNRKERWSDVKYQTLRSVAQKIDQLDEPKQPKTTLQDVTEKLWELPLNNRKYWLEQLNDEFQEGYIVPLGLKTTDGEEQYLTYNGSYFASRRNKYLQQTFDTLEEIPEFYRELAERVL